MDKMVMTELFKGIYNKRKVLITGHTGFKGSWLSFWLSEMGAEVFGISLPPPTNPNHINLLKFNYNSFIQNINERDKLTELVKEIDPEIIFHLAAQPIVRLSYSEPAETYMTNVMGTVNILDASRNLKNLKAIIVVTTDKCYENKDWVWGYRENDNLGGKDPYSSSKACAEIVTNAYRNSYYDPETFRKDHNVLISSARAGNVIGGGDWALDRIVTDIVISASAGESINIRYPAATRPWQHVLEPLSGYLTLGQMLLEGKKEYAEAWNFGPSIESNLSVLELVEMAGQYWQKIKYRIDGKIHPPEARFLMLDSSKAQKLLQWHPVWDFATTVKNTIEWYKLFYEQNTVSTIDQLDSYIIDAKARKAIWTQN